METTKKLPEYFTIKWDGNNPLWGKYTAWLKKEYNADLDWNSSNSFYGPANISGRPQAMYFMGPKAALLTLEEWNAMVNGSTMNQNEEDNKPERTAMQILIDHEEEVLKRMSSGFVERHFVDQQKERVKYLKQLHDTVEKEQLIGAYIDGNDDVSPHPSLTENWYNEKYPNHGK